MRFICLIAGFIFGSIPIGFLIGKANNVDVRKMGSGNIGSTNVQRNLGWKAGLLTFLGDTLKAVIPILIMQAVYKNAPEGKMFIAMWTGLGAVLGHDFSPWLSFKGGKGVATSCAVILMMDPLYFFICFGSFLIIVIITGYISAGSVIGAALFFAVALISFTSSTVSGMLILNHVSNGSFILEMIMLSAVISGLIIVRHRDNIKRLLNGTESKFHIVHR